MTEFYRFPHTPHLFWLASGVPRDDKVLSAAEAADLLAHEVVVEEKLDGANLGISVGEDGRLLTQNRGQYLESPFLGQFSRLDQWLKVHENNLFDALGTRLIVYGEWCAARHSITYRRLPDWWLLFDVYDKQEGRFWSTQRRNDLASELGIAHVPKLFAGSSTVTVLADYLNSARSCYRDGAMEGVVVRHEDDNWLLGRAKLVRADFTQSIDLHWRKKPLEWNRLELPASES